MNKYNPKILEMYIQKFWKKNKTFVAKINTNKKNKYYCLSMFPYPSGNLHIGHIRNYLIGDIFSRFNRMNNKNVMYPIGWDAFGLPAENAAIKNNISPKIWTFNNINYMRKQLKIFGFSFDWDKEIITCNSNYYKWEQFFFKKLYINKIAYKKYYPINWCNNDKTTLANEQVINNKCWRCNSEIKIRHIKQWFLKITDYSDNLLKNINKLKYWPKQVKIMQKNWIGKTKWLSIIFTLINLNNYKIKVECKNINEFININFIIITSKNNLYKIILNSLYKNNIYIYKNNINKHINKYLYIKTNIIAINNLINRYISIFIFSRNYMMYIYITKYIENKSINIFDINYYKKLNYYIKKKYTKNINIYKELENFFCINNIIFNNNMNLILKTNYIKYFYKFKIQDWCISRQRKWGVPIPIATFSNGKIKILPDNYIPVHPYFKNNKIYIDNKLLFLESDTFDTFLQSSWYYIRYTSSKCKNFMIDKKKSNYWLPVDQYIGGIEHSTMHLLYFRYYCKLLKKFNLININEPVIKLLCQGMVLSNSYYFINKKNEKIWLSHDDIKNFGKFNIKKEEIICNGLSKMSKSKNNGIDPYNLISKYGADALRIFIIFSAPVKDNLIWNENGIIGSYRFLNKIWNLVFFHLNNKNNIYYKNKNIDNNLLEITSNVIKNVTYDIKIKQSLNTSISNLMNFTKKILYFIKNNKYNFDFINEIISILLKLIYPFAPHISFFLLRKMGFKNIDFSEWPCYKNYLNNNLNNKYILYINNKFKLKFKINNNNLNKKNTINFILNNTNVKSFIKNKKIVNIIFIKNKLINLLII